VAQAAHVREAIATARTARHELGLGLDQPVHDVLPIVAETAGVPVAVLALGKGVAGAYIVRRDQAVIFLNGSEVVTRQRFTLAHELGHHRLGHRAVVDGTETVDGRATDPVEQQANAFAGEFLAPEQALRNWMDAHDHPLIDLAVLVRIAAWFGISAPAAYVRLVEAGILQRAGQRKQLKRQIDQGQHRGAEKALGLQPVADGLAQVQREDALPRLPARLRDNALAAYAAGLIDIDRLALALRRDRATVERLVAELGLAPAEPEPDW
jgi:Zn-dependent peptidase ImmA (M78 family)